MRKFWAEKLRLVWASRVYRMVALAFTVSLGFGSLGSAVWMTTADHRAGNPESGSPVRSIADGAASTLVKGNVSTAAAVPSPAPPGPSPSPAEPAPAKPAFTTDCPEAAPVPVQSGDSLGCVVDLTAPNLSGEDPGTSSQHDPRPHVQVYCASPETNRVQRGATITTSCRFQATPEFQDTLTVKCGAPAPITCSITPSTLTPRHLADAHATVTTTVGLDAPLQFTELEVIGSSPSLEPYGPATGLLDFHVVRSQDFGVECDSDKVTVVEPQSAQLECRVTTGNFRGELTVRSLQTDFPIGSTLLRALGIGPTTFDMAPNETARFTVDFPNARAGTYYFDIAAHDDAAHNGAVSSDYTTNGTRITYEVQAPTIVPEIIGG